MTTTKTGVVFAKLTKEQLEYMERVHLDERYVTPMQIDEVADVFDLYDKRRAELRAIRNSVAEYFGAIASGARTCGAWESYDRALAAMSAITSIIDHALFCAVA